MAPVIYTSEGKQLLEKLWKETMDELAFADPKDVIRANAE